MKKREVQELKNKPLEELRKLLKEYEERLRVLHFDVEAGKAKNLHTLRSLRRDVARVKTFIHIKEHVNVTS